MQKSERNVAFLLILLVAAAVAYFVSEAGMIPQSSQRKHPANASPAPGGHGSEAEAERSVMLSGRSIIRAGIRTVRAERREATQEISAVGVITIPEPGEITVAARARGRIEHLYVASSGASVRQGEKLYDLYSPEILNAEREYLIAAGGMVMDPKSMPAGMDHHTNAELLRASRERLRLFGLTERQIKDLGSAGVVPSVVTVYSPVSGLVLRKSAREGSYVDEGSTLFELADLSTVWAELQIPESSIRYVNQGARVTLTTEAYPKERFSGKVIFISPVEDQTSRSIRVRVQLPNSSGKLRPQMTFTATLPVPSQKLLALPSAAVVRTGKGAFAWVAEATDGAETSDARRFTAHALEVGELVDGYYPILSGVSEGDEVAAEGAFLVDAEYQFSKTDPMASMNMGEAGNKQQGDGIGTVRYIDASKRTITLDHNTIPGVMAAMTMAYGTADPASITKVKVGDQVRFTLRRTESGKYEITAIAKQ